MKPVFRGLCSHNLREQWNIVFRVRCIRYLSFFVDCLFLFFLLHLCRVDVIGRLLLYYLYLHLLFRRVEGYLLFIMQFLVTIFFDGSVVGLIFVCGNCWLTYLLCCNNNHLNFTCYYLSVSCEGYFCCYKLNWFFCGVGYGLYSKFSLFFFRWRGLRELE